MKVIEVNTPSVTAVRVAVIADGPILGDRRRFRVERMRVSYIWSQKEHRWAPQHIDLTGPMIKKDGTEGLNEGRKMLWSHDTGEVYDAFRLRARRLAPTGDPAFPGVLDA